MFKRHWIIWSIVIALAVFGLARLYYRMTDDFRYANMQYEMPYQKEWEIASLTASENAQLNAILDQPFTYVGKGAQAYAFESQDKRYILKFFKFKHLKPSSFLKFLPPVSPFKQYRETQEYRKIKKLNAVFAGYKLAYDKNKLESGLIYIHLNKTDNLNKSVTVKDKIGLKHTIELDPVVFVIQEKGKTLRTVLNDILKQNNVPLAITRINQIFDLYYTEYQKGFFDHDHGVLHNTGFVDNRAFHLDVGKLTPDEEIKLPENYEMDIAKVAVKINLWLRNNYPIVQPEISLAMEEHLSQLLQKPFYFKDYPTSFPKRKKNVFTKGLFSKFALLSKISHFWIDF